MAGFACLASQYVAELGCGRTPCIETVVTSTAQQVNEHLLKDCAALYSQLFEKEVAGRLPLEDDGELKVMHERCEKPAHQLLQQRAMVVDVDGDLGKKLSVSSAPPLFDIEDQPKMEKTLKITLKLKTQREASSHMFFFIL